ncbi:MAG: UTP--glucose-1-phosphate uridylyltransferase [Flavobacteriales bacterium]|nr:UTP--glucose-1-phosphate uridylyltransferase [Flavobacteriales bacterium]
MKVRKAVIPAAGFGTRMLPITSIVPKELLPVCGRPVIEHVVHEAAKAGIEEVILVISEGKEAVVDYFRPNKKLEAQLLKQGKHKELHELERIWNMVKITTVYQNEQLGLGHAVLCAKDAVGNEPFAVLLGDSIIHTDDCTSFTSKLLDAFNTYERSVVGVQQVEECLIHRYGIFEGGEFEDGIFHGRKLMEKPDQSQTDSNLAFCARYIFTPRIFQYLEQTQAGINNEIQLTDAMQQLLVSDGLNGVELKGDRFDVGDPKGLLLANLSLTEFDCD